VSLRSFAVNSTFTSTFFAPNSGMTLCTEREKIIEIKVEMSLIQIILLAPKGREIGS